MDELIKQAQGGDTQALEELWERTRKFAFTVARRFYTTTYADTNDLQQCAYLGVHTAAMQHTGRYDFLALVRWCTLRECQRLLDLYGSRRQLRADSLDIIMPDEETTLEDMIADEASPEGSSALEESETVRDVRAAVAELPARERMLIQQRWLGREVLPLHVVGKRMRISTERVRQLEERAFARLRDDPVLQTYATEPPSNLYRTGLSRFTNNGSSTPEHAALRLIRADEKRQARKLTHAAYADLLASLKAEGYL